MTFSQAEGAVSLPSQLALKEVSPELIARLWDVIHSGLRANQRSAGLIYPVIGGFWPDVLRAWHIEFEHGFADEYDSKVSHWVARIKAIFKTASYLRIFDFIQFVTRRISPSASTYKQIEQAFLISRAAYFLNEGTLYPKVTVEEGNALLTALETLKGSQLAGARHHISESSAALGMGDYARSVRESISAVESVVLVLDPSTDKIGAALSNLERAGKIHGSLKAAFAALYGYASDSEGIRHALVFENAAAVDEADAIFMLGACACFVTFVISRGGLTAT